MSIVLYSLLSLVKGLLKIRARWLFEGEVEGEGLFVEVEAVGSCESIDSKRGVSSSSLAWC